MLRKNKLVLNIVSSAVNFMTITPHRNFSFRKNVYSVFRTSKNATAMRLVLQPVSKSSAVVFNRGISKWRSFPKNNVQNLLNGIKAYGTEIQYLLFLILCMSAQHYSIHFDPEIVITEFIGLNYKHLEKVDGFELLKVEHIFFYSEIPKTCSINDPFDALLSQAFGRVKNHGASVSFALLSDLVSFVVIFFILAVLPTDNLYYFCKRSKIAIDCHHLDEDCDR